MRSSIIAFAAFLGLAAAHPGRRQQCLDDAAANKVAANFRSLIVNYSNASANAYLSPGFTDYSDSVNELINSGCPNGPAPLGSATFSSREAFEVGQGGQPPIPWDTLKVWHGCDFVTVRWRSSAPGTVQPEEPVTGIVVIETCPGGPGGQPWLIDTVYSEFNSGAWLYDLGVFQPTCPPPAQSKVKRTASGLPIRIM